MHARENLNSFLALSTMPLEGRQEWLSSAEAGVAFVRASEAGPEVTLYASARFGGIHTALAPADAVSPPDAADLLDKFIDVSSTWHISETYGPGDKTSIDIAGPMGLGEPKSLASGEMTVCRRSWEGMGRRNPVEISQKLIHCLDLHYVEERSAYCRLDDNGDVESIISIVECSDHAREDWHCYVSIKRSELDRYMCLSDQCLVQRFDFTRTEPESFHGWAEPERGEHGNGDLVYRTGVQAGHGSWANGFQIVRPKLTKEDLLRRTRTRTSTNKEYETFITLDWKNNTVVEVSCDPECTSNYFTPSEKPFDTSPAFFRGEVLQRYKADPDKYEIGDRDIGCRNAWYLRGYDINEAGQVHAYLCYLRNLPYNEQKYWRAFNEPPKAGISKRAFESDFQGSWDTEYDPLRSLKTTVSKLDENPPRWWKKRGRTAFSLRYPVGESTKEWGDEILALDQLVCEGFKETELVKLCEAAGGSRPKETGSLNALRECLVSLGLGAAASEKAVSALRAVRRHRSKLRGHLAPEESMALSKAAISEFQTYRSHFRGMCAACDTALSQIVATLRTADS